MGSVAAAGRQYRIDVASVTNAERRCNTKRSLKMIQNA